MVDDGDDDGIHLMSYMASDYYFFMLQHFKYRLIIIIIICSVLSGRATLLCSISIVFDVLHTRVEFGKRAFSGDRPNAWNNSPPSLRQITDIGQFKRAFKTHLYEVIYKFNCIFHLYVLSPIDQILLV